MWSLFEPEEAIGQAWHRLVGKRASYPRHADAAVALESVRGSLAVFFRALGGDPAVRLASAASTASGHRLGLIQRLGLGSETIERAALDGEVLQLPGVIDVFPEARLNERLFEWLAAYFAHAQAPTQAATERADDPLRADILSLRHAQAATARALARWPGLRRLHDELAAALRALRPQRRLAGAEAAVEDAALSLLGRERIGADAARMLDERVPLSAFSAPVGYHPFLPVPLWGEVAEGARGGGVATAEDAERDGKAKPADQDTRRRKAKRSDTDQAQRKDPLMLNRFDKLLSFGEMVNLPRAIDDEDENNARKAADDMEEISVGQHDRKAATLIKLDLELAPPAADTTSIIAAFTYPEWDYSRNAYHPAHTRVVAEPAPSEGEDWRPDAEAHRRIRQVRRQFEALRPKRVVLTGQADGDELDLSAVVRSRCDLKAGGHGSDRVYLAQRSAARDLAVAVLVDASLSTDGWIDGRRVLDVEKEAVMALAHGLNACGDAHALYAFTSKRRDWVRVQTLKDFDEPLNAAVDRRIGALKPGYYTRIGAAIRHTAARLALRPNRHRLLVLLSDGKPNDVDHYEGRYGIEDTRMAIREARREGLAVFGITVDAEARDYFPYLFGRGGHAIFPHAAHLTKALPALYRQVVG